MSFIRRARNKKKGQPRTKVAKIKRSFVQCDRCGKKTQDLEKHQKRLECQAETRHRYMINLGYVRCLSGSVSTLLRHVDFDLVRREPTVVWQNQIVAVPWAPEWAVMIADMAEYTVIKRMNAIYEILDASHRAEETLARWRDIAALSRAARRAKHGG